MLEFIFCVLRLSYRSLPGYMYMYMYMYVGTCMYMNSLLIIIFDLHSWLEPTGEFIVLSISESCVHSISTFHIPLHTLSLCT